MAKFFVGQRVRIKWSLKWPELSGCEGTVVGITDGSKSPTRGPHGSGPGLYYEVVPDGCTSNLLPLATSPTGVSYFAPSPDQLEPLIKPDNEVGSWEKLGWHPSEFLAKNPSEFTQQKEKIA